MNRRQFNACVAALTTSAAPVLSNAVPTNSLSSQLQTHAVLDQRVIPGNDAIILLRQSCHFVHSYALDVTPIWYHTLAPLWQKKQIQTVGITRHSEFFILKTLAGEHGYAVRNLHEHPDFAVWSLVPHSFS